MRETIFIFLFSTILTITFAQQITLKGQVSIHNSKYNTGKIKYVENTAISSPFSVPITSDIAGKFDLIFTGMDAGTAVKVSAEKADLEVVNDHDLKRVIIGRKPLLRIYLADKGRLAEAQTELYNISKKALFAKKDALIARLQGSEQESKAALQELQENFGAEIKSVGAAIELLENKIAELDKRLPEFAQKLAAQNLDFASDLYIQAYEKYKKGAIEEAIAVLDEAKLDAAYEAAITAIQQAKTDVAALEDAIAKRELEIEQIVESYELKAESHSLLFQYQEAVAIYKNIINILIESKGGNSLEVADAYDEIGGLYRDFGDYSNAFKYRSKNVGIKEKLLDENDIDLAISYNNLASIYQVLGDYKKALNTQQKAIVIIERPLVSNHPYVTQFYNNLAVIQQALGKYTKALIAQQKALTIQEQILKYNHIYIAASYNNLASIYQDLGSYEKALVAQQKDITIIEQTLEPNHPRIAISYNNLAMIYKDLRSHEKALSAQQKALAIQELIFEHNHPRTATFYNNLGSIYQDLGEYEKALVAQQKDITIIEQTLEPNHPKIATSYNNLATIYQNLGKYEEALTAQQKALAIDEQSLGLSHPRIATSYNNLASIYKDLGRYEEALAAQQKDIAIIEQTLDLNHPNIATSYHNLSSIFYNSNQLDSAIHYEYKAYVIWQEKLPESHPSLKVAESNLMFSHKKRGQLRRTNGLYKKAIEDFQTAIEYADSIAVTSLYNLIGLNYYYDKQYEKAIIYYDKNYELNKDNQMVYLNNSGMAYMKLGNFKEAKTRFEQLQELIPKNGIVYRNWAIYYALQKEKEFALTNLEKAIQLGFTDLQKIQNEEAFQTLHNEPRYHAILQQLKDKNKKD